MNKDFVEQLFEEHQSTPKCPSPREVGKWFNKLLLCFEFNDLIYLI